MASNVTIELTLQKDVLLAIPTDPTPTLPTPDDPLPWEHSFHHKFLTLNFAGYLILRDDWLDRVTKFVKGSNLAEVLRGTASQTEDRFRELVRHLDETVPEETLKSFASVIGTDLGAGGRRREFIEKKCRNDILTEIRRYKSIYIPKDTGVSKQEPTDKPVEEIPAKYASILPIIREGSEEGERALMEEAERRVEEEMGRGFRIMFGRRDHHLVSALVSALWSMKGEGNIRMAFVPKEQLLSVDMEDREARELTLQLHPKKPAYRRRDRDEIRGREEIFADALPWCRVPGGRALSRIIDSRLYEAISGAAPVTMWTEDSWAMSERRRLHREERKRDKDTVPLKVTESRVQVNHFLPILKETTGFKGYIREDRFYEGLKGLLYLIQVSLVEDTSPPDRATHLERVVSEELLHRKEERKAKRDRKLLEEKEKAKNKT